jgi:hypothetical protein
MNRIRFALALVLCVAPSAARAHGPDGHPADPNLHVNPSLEDCNVQFAPELTQDAFARFVREFGSVSAFKQVSAPVTLGRGRLELGLGQTSFSIEDRADAWNDTFYHPDAYHELGSHQDFPKLRARYGVSDRVDVGTYWTRNPNANYGWLGLEVMVAMMRQSETTPVSLAVRGAYTKTLYVDDMDMHAATLDISAGRTLWNVVTPYVGVGTDGIYARETSAAVNLDDEWQSASRAFAGVGARLWHLGVAVEGEVGALNRFEFQVSGMF